MSSKHARKSRTRSSTKTTTPMLNATARSGPGARAQVPTTYLENLTKERINLDRIFQEVPSSRSGSPVEGQDSAASKARADTLRRKVEEAFKYANGDPADGKWSTVADLLQLKTAMRTRWLGTTTEGKMPESSLGWVNAATELEWEEWEARRKQELILKEKVQSWQQKVEPASVVTISQDPVEPPRRAKKAEPSKVQPKKILRDGSGRNSSALNFPVVKRSSLTVIGKPKPSQEQPVAGPSKYFAAARPHDIEEISETSPSNNPKPSNIDSGASRDPTPANASSAPIKPRRDIQDLSEMSFLPPSFPSQLQTSTPTGKRHKPPPIVLAPTSSPLSSPPPTQVLERRQTAMQPTSSLSGVPSTPTRHPKPRQPSLRIRPREKRARSITPPRVFKKARLTPSVAASTSEAPAPPSIPSHSPGKPTDPDPVLATGTPPQAPLPPPPPKLTDLLASSKKLKAVSVSLAAFSPRVTKSRKITATVLQPEPDVSLQPQPAPEPAPASTPIPASVSVGSVGSEPAVAPEPEPEPEPEPAPPPPAVSTPASDDVYEPLNDVRSTPRQGSSTRNYPSSPARSLSSLAASDSDDDEEQQAGAGLGLDLDLGAVDLGLSGFAPPFTSTKATGGAGGGWAGYNSQFDVDGKVDVLSKFMERDVEFDVDGWLRDPSVEVESQ